MTKLMLTDRPLHPQAQTVADGFQKGRMNRRVYLAMMAALDGAECEAQDQLKFAEGEGRQEALRGSPAMHRAPLQAGRGSRETSAISASATTHFAGHRLFRAERARGTLEEGLCPDQIAELSLRDASERERRRVFAQGDPFNAPRGRPPRGRAPRR